jgi:hypothetical protein
MHDRIVIQKMAFYDQEIRAMEQVLARFQDQAWGMLLAPCQSGKTNTFLLTACEMMRAGVVDRAVVFSGNRETDLRDQLIEKKQEIKTIYQTFLRTRGVEPELIAETLVEKIDIHFGQSLKDYQAQGKTLYIWEESHYGQSKRQEVDLFLRRMGIQATGKLPEGCFLLSVSATPFSELSDQHHMSQGKFVVQLVPSDQYLSVKKMMENGQIRNVKDPVKEFGAILASVQDGYGLVRASDKKQKEMSEMATSAGFVVIQCDMKNKFDLNQTLKVRPDTKTIIFLKGMCRMGKQVAKTHVRFVMETSCGKTDTLLQSLLGRMCGYDSRPDILVYIKKLPLEELEKYNQLHEGVFTSIPSKAMNIRSSNVLKTRFPLKPIRITLDVDPEACLARNVLQMLDQLEHQNSEEDMAVALPIIRSHAEAFAKLPSDRSVKEKKMAKHWLQHKQGKVYKLAMPHIEEAWRTGTAQCEFGSGAGVSATEDEVVIWRNKRHLYIVMQIEKSMIDAQVVPVTTKREVFCRETADGGATFSVSPATRNQPLEMEKALNSLIEASRVLGPAKFTSNGYGEYILLTEAVFAHIQTLAETWKHQGVFIKTKKVRKPVGMTDVRLSEITWSVGVAPLQPR